MRFLLAVLGPILIDGVRSSQSEDARVLACGRSMVEFLLVLGQCNHSDYTLGLLDNGLSIFYTSKSVFHPQRSITARTPSAKCKNQSWSTKSGYGPPGPPGPP